MPLVRGGCSLYDEKSDAFFSAYIATHSQSEVAQDNVPSPVVDVSGVKPECRSGIFIETVKKLLKYKTCLSPNNISCWSCPLSNLYNSKGCVEFFGGNWQDALDARLAWLRAYLDAYDKPQTPLGITAFKSGCWYVYEGPAERQAGWDSSGSMDFVLDGKPHRVKRGENGMASFYDYCRPDVVWSWRSSMQYFREVPPPEAVTKNVQSWQMIDDVARDAQRDSAEGMTLQQLHAKLCKIGKTEWKATVFTDPASDAPEVVLTNRSAIRTRVRDVLHDL
jgi:hypothetical protein